MDDTEIKYFIESALLAAGRPLTVEQLQNLFEEASSPEKSQIRQAIRNLIEEYEDRGVTIAEVASGFRMQVKASMANRLQKLWEERPPRYSRALFETLALIAYRQPMTRGEIEEIRGVSVSSNIVRSLLEREWIRVVGHRDVPGRPAMFATTKPFLDYFGLKKLDDLPPLADLSDWESLRVQLNLPAVEDSEEQQMEAGEVLEIPVLHAEIEGAGDDDGEVDDGAVNMPADHGFEELVASEWPEANGSLPVLEPTEAEQGDAAETRSDSDTTLTG
jgi:segregation and condensation protein B